MGIRSRLYFTNLKEDFFLICNFRLTYSLARYKESKETDLEKLQDSLKLAALQIQRLFDLSSKI